MTDIIRRKLPVKDYDQFQLRLSPGLRDEIKDEAKATGRSMNDVMLSRLSEQSKFAQADLRDTFAGQALANTYTAHEGSPDKIAEWAYQVADAMIAARKGGAA